MKPTLTIACAAVSALQIRLAQCRASEHEARAELEEARRRGPAPDMHLMLKAAEARARGLAEASDRVSDELVGAQQRLSEMLRQHPAANGNWFDSNPAA